MPKLPELLIAGRVKVETDSDTFEELDKVLIIQFDDPAQLRESLFSGKVEFAVWGNRAAEQRDEADGGTSTDKSASASERCEHDWIPAGEQVIEEAKFCPKCGIVRSLRDTSR